MANYLNQLMVYVDGKRKKISAADNIEIGGGFTAGSFTGDGSALSNLNASNLASGEVADARLSSNVTKYNDAAPNFTNGITAPSFSGSGASLTSLNASNLSSGTVADARLSANVPLLNALTNAFTGSVSAVSFSGDGAALSNLNASNVASGTLDDGRLSSNVAKYNDAAPNFTNGITAPSFSGSGASLTSLNGSNISSGTVADARLSANVALKNAALNAFSGSMTVGGNLTVTGKIVSAGSSEVVLKDQFIDLAGGNTAFGAVLAGGMAVNVECLTATPFTATDFTVGNAGANPTVTVSENASGLAAGDLIQISGSTDSLNDGQYVVSSVSGTGPTVITVKGTALMPVSTSAQTPFAHNQFAAQSSQTASLVKIRVSAFSAANGVLTDSASNAIPTGTFCFASGATESAFIDGWTDVDPGSVPAVTLQSAYDASASPVTIETTAAGGFTVKPATGELAAISLQSAAASDITVDGATLDIGASRIDLNDGNVAFEKAGEIAGITTGALAVGTICYVNSSGAATASDKDSGTDAALEVDGVVTDDSNHLATVFGTKVVVAYAGTPPAVGDLVYLSGGANAGKCQKALPTAGRVTVLGKCIDGGAGGLCTIIWAPDYIADL